MTSKRLENITQIFSEGDLEGNGPVRILVQGKENLVLRLLFCRLSHCDIFYIFPMTKNIDVLLFQNTANGGMGKSTATKYLAISWADGTAEELQKFDFVFHIALKKVKDGSPIENIIIQQHSGLKASKVKPVEVKGILEGDTNSKVMVILDGHDEYTVGRNFDIDEAIVKEKLGNCWVVITSKRN